MIGNDVDETKQKLWDNLNKKNSMDFVDFGGLQRLVTFMERPSFKRENSMLTLPQLNYHGSLINQNKKSLDQLEKPRKSSFLQMDQYPTSNQIRFGNFEFKSIINIRIKIDQEKGFTPITPEIAVGLRQLTFGNLKQSLSEDWRKAFFSFKDMSGPFGFSLYSEKNSARGLLVCVQTYFLKSILYTLDVSNESRSRLLNMTESRRLDCLARALSDVLWKVSDKRKVFVCLPSSESYVDQFHLYTCDKVTEKIHIFKLKSFDMLRSFFRKHISVFTSMNSSGCLLFLYSIVLSKGLEELFEDFDFDTTKCLLTNIDTLSQSAINLIITGNATEYLHNGILYYDQSNNYLLRPKHGIKERSDIGYLQYNTQEVTDYMTLFSKGGRRASDSQLSSQVDLEQLNVVGSMLKTPKYPIWITNGNGNMGVLFSLRDDLLNHWRVENNFNLNYLNLLPSQVEPCILSIATRRGRTAKFKSALQRNDENKKIPLLNHIINTKWFGCKVDWNNTSTFI